MTDLVNAKRSQLTKRMWPLTAPGLAFPGECFQEYARLLGDTESGIASVGKGKNKRTIATAGPILTKLMRDCLYGTRDVKFSIQVSSSQYHTAHILPGHAWGLEEGGAKGPSPADVMVISRVVTEEEMNKQRYLIGDSGKLLLSTCRQLGIKGINHWYITAVLKTDDPTEGKKANLTSFNKQFQHLLEQEIRIVKPKYILCLGTDALKALFGNSMNQTKAEGRVLEYTYRTNESDADEPAFNTVKVMSCLHPKAVLLDPQRQGLFTRTVDRFGKLVQGENWAAPEKDITCTVVDNEIALQKLIARARRENPKRIVAVDAEWQGQHPQNAGAYLRCVQFSWSHNDSCVIALTHPGGAPRFRRLARRADGKPIYDVRKGKLVPRWTTQGGKEVAMRLFEDYLRGHRIAGFFLAADAEWLIYNGVNMYELLDVPKDWTKTRSEGALFVELMAHAADEADEFELNSQITRWLDLPRYDMALVEWLKQHAAKKKKGAGGINGYGEVPDNILYPYGGLDAVATRRLAIAHMKRVDLDEFGNCCWETYTADARAMLPVIEINTGGLMIDRERLQELTQLFIQRRDEFRVQLREMFNWEELNLESSQQVREILFGEQYALAPSERDETSGTPVRLRPPNALSLYARPVINTDKRPRQWIDIINDKEEDQHTPSVKATAVGIMIQEGKKLPCWDKQKEDWVHQDHGDKLCALRDYRFLNQVLKTVLKPPKWDQASSNYATDEDGQPVYERGLGKCICRDSMVRTFITMLLETGRWASSRPNLQNISKRREKEYVRLLGNSYKYTLRSIFRADPGHVLIEADYIGAELFGMAIMARDKTMIEHALRNQLPEDHPKHYDIHSHVAVLAFKLECAPSKAGLRSIDKENLRIVAKAVIFGIAYGRGAKAIAMAAKEDKVEITTEEAQEVIDTVFEMYPGLRPLFDSCKARATDPVSYRRDECAARKGTKAPRFLRNCFGRIRRFPWTKDDKLRADFEREAMNFPIQGMIADVVTRAIRNIYDYRNKHNLKFRISMQIHDALLFCVPYDEVDIVINKVLPLCMIKQVPIWPSNVDGEPHDIEKPYHLGIDVEISENWGEMLYPEWLEERNIDIKHAHWKYDAKLDAYTHEKKEGKYWKNGHWHKKSEVTAA